MGLICLAMEEDNREHPYLPALERGLRIEVGPME